MPAHPRPPHHASEAPGGAARETARIEAFSDGVFAFAITLLVLDLSPPAPNPSGPPLAALLLRQWPSYLAFATSFAFIGIMWINHHRLFALIRWVDHGLLILNGLLLGGVTVIPYPTRLLAEYLLRRDHRTAAMVYGGTYLVVACLFYSLWKHASSNGRLLGLDASTQSIQAIDRSYAVGPLAYLVTFGLSMVSLPAFLVANGMVALFFVLPEKHQLRLPTWRR